MRILILLLFFHCTASFAQKRLLIFAKTAGYHHQSIANGFPALQKLSAEHKFLADTTTDASQFTLKNLKRYAAVVFLSTTGDVLDEQQQKAFEDYIHQGGGFVGIHAASDTEYGWPWYGKLVGAYFVSHPAQQEAVLHVVDPNTIATRHFPLEWKRKDEWYNFKEIQTDLHILMTLDEKTYTGGINGDPHPFAWYHDFDGGRAFYTGLGHMEDSYTDPLFLKHVLGGILYATGTKKMELKK
ncbi:Crp/Fnr family transcriptional regulator [Pedobacter sp. HMWF019]|uniref:ThuA domain-containing protein n=1 Tax=Pedobacter sp. HMWF019 TaxID=2056856 RepID=UPI000D33D95B|nr:ThuA domain-containing protein [Pedobacter sp. HMWF019]PTT03751.1 Crp/Fnr family transcriptional regulator [Pedobacter sp. HMWF019]